MKVLKLISGNPPSPDPDRNIRQHLHAFLQFIKQFSCCTDTALARVPPHYTSFLEPPCSGIISVVLTSA